MHADRQFGDTISCVVNGNEELSDCRIDGMSNSRRSCCTVDNEGLDRPDPTVAYCWEEDNDEQMAVDS